MSQQEHVQSSDASETTNDQEFSQKIERILDVPLDIQVELGRKKMQIGELLNMTVGSVVELNQPASSNLSVYANQTLIATGEVVVVGEKYGIRITDIVSPTERVKRLGNGGS